MKIYNQSSQKLDLADSLVSDKWEDDCTHVLYDCDFYEILKRWTPDKKALNFISTKNFKNDKDLTGIIHHEQNLNTLTFCEEKVTEVSDKIRSYLSGIELTETFGDINKYITLISTELVQNSLIYQRIHNVKNNIYLQITVFDDQVQIVVTDPYGALELEHIFKKLKRCVIDGTYEQKKGAGLGLYMVTRSCDKMIVKVDPKKSTKVCCIINRYQRLKQYKLKNTSFYYIKGGK